jgi:hypothetical protein
MTTIPLNTEEGDAKPYTPSGIFVIEGEKALLLVQDQALSLLISSSFFTSSLQDDDESSAENMVRISFSRQIGLH